MRIAERAVGHEGVVEVPWVLRIALKREECRDLGLEAVGDYVKGEYERGKRKMIGTKGTNLDGLVTRGSRFAGYAPVLEAWDRRWAEELANASEFVYGFICRNFGAVGRVGQGLGWNGRRRGASVVSGWIRKAGAGMGFGGWMPANDDCRLGRGCAV